MKNDIKEVLLSEEQIQAKVKELAAQISREELAEKYSVQSDGEQQ